MKYKVIKSREQSDQYCSILEQLLITNSSEDEIELLTLLIEIWDEDHNSFDDIDSITLLQSLMKEHGLKVNDLADMLNVGSKLVSEFLTYKRDLPKGIIRVLSKHFKVSEQVFDRPYLPCL